MIGQGGKAACLAQGCAGWGLYPKLGAVAALGCGIRRLHLVLAPDGFVAIARADLEVDGAAFVQPAVITGHAHGDGRSRTLSHFGAAGDGRFWKAEGIGGGQQACGQAAVGIRVYFSAQGLGYAACRCGAGGDGCVRAVSIARQIDVELSGLAACFVKAVT